MKHRLILRLLSLLLLTLLLPAFPACRGGSGGGNRLMLMDEESRAYALYAAMAESLLDAPAFAVKSTTSFSGRMNGQGLDIICTVNQISKDQNGKGRMDLYESSYVTRKGGAYGETEETRMVSGYADGYIFRSHQEDGYAINAKTEISFDDYWYEYLRLSEQIILNPEAWNCENVLCWKNHDGSFTASFSGLNYEGLDDLSYDYGLDLSMISDSVYLTEASMVVNSTPDLLFQNAFIYLTYNEYDYEGNPTAREYTVTTEQTFAYAIPEDFKGVDLSAYEDIGDLTVLDDYLLYFENRVYADGGSYTYTSRETATEDGVPSVWRYDVNMDIDTFGSGLSYASDGSYGYEGEIYRSRVSYEDGVISFYETDPKGDTNVESYHYTEDDVRMVINAELSLRDFASYYVTRIEERDAAAGKYRFHLGGGLEGEYRSYFAERKGSMKSFEAYLDVTIRDGELMEYELYLAAEGFTETAESHRYEMKASCIFEEKFTSSAPI